MSKSQTILKRIVTIILVALTGFFALVLILIGVINQGFFDFALHLVGGFGFFLARNIPAISVNAATWVPGVLAFLLALALGHGFLKNRAIRQGRGWSFKTTLSLGLLLPVLFCIAFIVPGLLLQMDLLRQSPWFEHQRGQRAFLIMTLRDYALTCYLLADEAPDKRFPETLEALEEKGLMAVGKFNRLSDSMLPPEPFIYLGAGRTLSSDESLPLCISPPYREKGENFRQVATLGGQMIQIRDDELGEWIDRAVPRAEKGAP